MTTIERVCEFLQEREFRFSQDDEKPIVRASFAGDNGTLDTVIEAWDGPARATVFVYCPVRIPEQARMLVGDYVLRANWMLAGGCFELNLENGVLRYRTTTLVREGTLDDDAMGFLLFGSLNTVDAHLAGILAVSHGGTAPADAFRAAVDREQAGASEGESLN